MDGHHAMIIAPVNVLANWKGEFYKWLDDDARPNIISMADNLKTNKDRMRALERWRRQGGCLIIGFEMIRNLCAHIRKACFRATHYIKYRRWRAAIVACLVHEI